MFAKIFLGLLALLGMIVVGVFVAVFPAMLLFGAVSSFIAWVPALSFVQTLITIIFIATIGAVFNATTFKLSLS